MSLEELLASARELSLEQLYQLDMAAQQQIAAYVESVLSVEHFNPNEHIIQLKNKNGSSDYLPVQWRIVWFRVKHPHGRITTEMLALDLDRDTEEEGYQWNQETRRSEKTTKHAKGFALFKARVEDGHGGVGEGSKSEKAASFPDFIEKAETGAIGRALAALGYGTQFAPELNEEHRIVDAPVERGAVLTASSPAPVNNNAGTTPRSQASPTLPVSSRPVAEPVVAQETKTPVATGQQIASIRKLCQQLGKPEPDHPETLTYHEASALVSQLSQEYRQKNSGKMKTPAWPAALQGEPDTTPSEEALAAFSEWRERMGLGSDHLHAWAAYREMCGNTSTPIRQLTLGELRMFMDPANEQRWTGDVGPKWSDAPLVAGSPLEKSIKQYASVLGPFNVEKFLGGRRLAALSQGEADRLVYVLRHATLLFEIARVLEADGAFAHLRGVFKVHHILELFDPNRQTRDRDVADYQYYLLNRLKREEIEALPPEREALKTRTLALYDEHIGRSTGSIPQLALKKAS